jgi:DNA (cytosine-5)-methyltransferase 1
VEREATAALILAARFADGSLDEAPIWSDLRTFDGSAWRGSVDLLTAGYPCQPFSCAGKRKGKEDPRHLFPHVARIADESQPAAVFLENVEGHFTLGFREVAKKLQRMGYEVEADCFSAQEVGATHLRKRLFALAYSDDIGRRGGRSGVESSAGIRRRQPEALGAELAYGNRGGLSRIRAAYNYNGRNESRDDINGRDAELEDSSRDGRNGSARSNGRRGRGVRKAGDALGEVVGVSKILRYAELSNGKHRKAERSAVMRTDLPVFAPGPEDLESWARLLRSNPEVEPAIRGTAYGIASRVDRLRSLGNGVVPLVAAFALRTLARRVGADVFFGFTRSEIAQAA